jgi:hypothetical protein
VFGRSFITRVVSIKFVHLGLVGLISVKSNLLLDRLNVNILIGKTDLRFYWGVCLIEGHCEISCVK